MGERVATILDVAKRAGVSKTTASDALAGAGRVSEATRARITEAASDLGYAPNRAAQHLRRSSVGAVGLYIPPRVMSMSFYMEFAFGAAEQAQVLDLDLTLLAPSRSHQPRRPRVDGLMVVDPLPADPVVAGLFGAGLPTVAVGRYEGTGAQASATLEVDHYAMILQLLDHLASAGSHRPGLIGPDSNFDSSWARQVKSAYRDWCLTRRIAPQVREVVVDINPAQIDEAVASLVRHAGVDGLVCAPDGSAVRALTSLRALGVAVGADFPLASCAGGRGTELSVPSITTIDLRPHDYGLAATRLLTDILGGEITLPAHRTHRAVLTPRASTLDRPPRRTLHSGIE